MIKHLRGWRIDEVENESSTIIDKLDVAMEVNGEINKKVVGIKCKMRNTGYDGIWITNEYDKFYRLFYNYLIEI